MAQGLDYAPRSANGPPPAALILTTQVSHAREEIVPKKVTEAQAAERFKEHGGTLVSGTWVNTQEHCTVICDTCKRKNTKARYNDIVNKGHGVCGGTCRSEKISVALKTPDSEARDAMRQGGWEPAAAVPFPGKGKSWPCKCVDCSTEYPKRLSVVQDGGGGCRNCLGMVIDPDEAAAIMISHDHEPIDPYPGSSQKPWPAWCLRCRAKGRSVVTTAYFSRIKYRGHQCWSCRSERLSEALRYSNEEASTLMMKFGYRPTVEYPGSVEALWDCIHEGTEDIPCGRQVRPTLHNILAGQGGCSSCAQRGPDYAAPGYLYLITRNVTGKIGIGGSLVNPGNDRLRTHARENWTTVARWEFEKLLEAHSVEQAAKSWLRRSGVNWVREEDMPYGGHTETFSLTEISASSIQEFIDNYMRRGQAGILQ